MLQESILQYFLPALSDNWYLKPIFGVLSEWPLKTGFTVRLDIPCELSALYDIPCELSALYFILCLIFSLKSQK